MDLAALPGSELIREGLEDLGAGRETATALLVVIGAPLVIDKEEFKPSDTDTRLEELLRRIVREVKGRT